MPSVRPISTGWIPLRDGVFHKYQGQSADGSIQCVTSATHLNRSHDSPHCRGNQKPRLKAKCQYLIHMTRMINDSSICSELQVYKLSNQSRLATMGHWVGWKRNVCPRCQHGEWNPVGIVNTCNPKQMAEILEMTISSAFSPWNIL